MTQKLRNSRAMWVAMGLIICGLLFLGASRTGSPRTQQDRIDLITSHLACPTCSGESVFSSRASGAQAIRNEVARQVATATRTDDEIVTYIVQRFGGQTLLVPRATGIDSLIWALPATGFIVALWLIIGVFIRWRKPQIQISVPMSQSDLATQRKFIEDSLADLECEHQVGDLNDDDYQKLRNEYLLRLTPIETLANSDKVAPTSQRAKNSFQKTGIKVFAVLLVASGVGLFVARQSGQRLTGQSLTGNIEDSTASLLSQARASNFVDPKAAIELYTQVLSTNPDNAEALTYRAWLIALIARSAGDQVRQLAFVSASTDLERAIEIDPKYPDAHCFLGIVRFRLGGDAIGASEQLEICSAMNPPSEVKSFVDSIVGEVNAALEE